MKPQAWSWSPLVGIAQRPSGEDHHPSRGQERRRRGDRPPHAASISRRGYDAAGLTPATRLGGGAATYGVSSARVRKRAAV